MRLCYMGKLPIFPLLFGAAVLKSSHSYRDRKCESSTTRTTEKKDIIETALGAGSFRTLIQAVLATGLDQTLREEGPFTVFAPTDEAFSRLPEGALQELLKPESKEKLTSILTYHVIPAKVMAADLTESSDVIPSRNVKTVNGKLLTARVEDGAVRIGKAKVTSADIRCSNGVIHVIDTVLLSE